MLRDDRKKVIAICLDLQGLLQKTYRNMDGSNERSLPIYRGEAMAYKLAIQKLIEEFDISRMELSDARKKREERNVN